MKEYLIFHYVIDGQSYVEAYPIQGDAAYEPSYAWWARLLGNNVNEDEIAFCSAPNRTDARRAAYCNWVRSDGVGFNVLPYRVYAKEAR